MGNKTRTGLSILLTLAVVAAALLISPVVMGTNATSTRTKNLISDTTFYFAEGTTRPYFDPYFCIQNTGGTTADITITYMMGDGSIFHDNITVPPTSRATVNPKTLLGTGDDIAHDFSTKIACTNGQKIVAERPMYFDYNGVWTGGHDVVGAKGPSTEFYFAEGTCRPGFDTYLCLQNPGDTQANVDLMYMEGVEALGSLIHDSVIVPPHSRATVIPRDKIGTGDDAAHDFSTTVQSDQPIVAERPMYFNYQNKWTGGSDVMGAAVPSNPSNNYYFAEGTCRPNFDTYFTLQNPYTSSSKVHLTYYKGDGTTATDDVSIGAMSRVTVYPRNKIGTGDDAAHDFSTAMTSTDFRPFVAERPMYFNYRGWTGGHDVVGLANSPLLYYEFAEGTTRPGFDSYITVENPGSDGIAVTITYMLGDGTVKNQNLMVDAYSRSTVHPADVLGVGDDAAHDFSATVGADDDAPLVVERPMYFDYQGMYTGGSDVVGYTPSP